jgi:hypothetical protein
MPPAPVKPVDIGRQFANIKRAVLMPIGAARDAIIRTTQAMMFILIPAAAGLF